ANMLLYYDRYDEALAESRAAVEIDPLSTSAFDMVALVQIRKGDLDGATDTLKKSQDLDPDDPLAVTWLAYIDMKRDHYREATLRLEKVAERSHRKSSDLRDLGYCYAMSGRRDDAKKILAEVKSKLEKGEAYAYQLAGIYAGLGDNDSAFDWLYRG